MGIAIVGSADGRCQGLLLLQNPFTPNVHVDFEITSRLRCRNPATHKTALKQSRGKRPHATIPRIPQLTQLLNDLQTRERHEGVNTVLVNSFGQAWSGNGFGASLNRVRDAANIRHIDTETGESKTKHLHDVRDTFCTKLILANLTDQEAASIMGWSPDQVACIRRVYVDQGRVIVATRRRFTGAL